ncbi:hypothetical protein UCMB321_0987 [Pseudomonas batumici]|uniref:Uncharacterized protein n=1 Tax=Pseudomonas batumici TaxID=226910 RepID=A0A0C2EGQ7_9PSED|nr:hypothetical protein UCMB321_0987 [Pseudomonas batumici]
MERSEQGFNGHGVLHGAGGIYDQDNISPGTRRPALLI